MIPVYLIEENLETYKKALEKRHFKDTDLLEKVAALNEERKKHKRSLDLTLAESNKISKTIGQFFAQGKKEEAEKAKKESAGLKEKSKALQADLQKAEQELEEVLNTIPNIPHEEVPAGKGENDNTIIFQEDDLPQLPEKAQAHWDLMDKYDLVDMELGNKIAGAGFPVFKGKGALLQRALKHFFLDKAIENGYQEFIPPYLVNADTAYGTGQLPDKEGQMYEMKLDSYYLIPTAEVPVTNIYRDHIFKEEDLPVKMTAHSHCFRREAGSYGKEVRGLNRVHQFEKVEIVQLVHPDKSYEVLEEMTDYAISLLKALKLPYRKLLLCGGDMGFTAAKTYDLEVYSAAQQRWLEVSSVSNFEFFQSNRMKMRFKNADKKTQLIHTLNGSALALPRIYAAILENNQDEKGINIPEVLRPYTGFDRIE